MIFHPNTQVGFKLTFYSYSLEFVVNLVNLGLFFYPGLHLGAILASVSPAVVVPTVMNHNARGFGAKSQIALLVGNAGGLDTAFTEGMFGIINSAIFYQSSMTYRIIKVFSNAEKLA